MLVAGTRIYNNVGNLPGDLLILGLLDHRIEPDFTLGEIIQLFDQDILQESDLEAQRRFQASISRDK